MEVNLYCIWCGGRLGVEENHVICFNCDAEYSNILLSVTEEEKESCTVVEKSVSMDCLMVKPKEIPILGIQSQPIGVEIEAVSD